MLSSKSSRMAFSGLISLLVGVGIICAYHPWNAPRGIIEHSDSGLRRNARSPVASDLALEPRFKGTWLDPESVDSSLNNLGAWSETVGEPTTTEPKPDSVDADFEQWKRERRDVAVVRRMVDARRQAPVPTPSDVFPPTPPDVPTIISDVRTATVDELVSECLSSNSNNTASSSECIYRVLLTIFDQLDEAGILELLNSANPVVAAAVTEVIADLKTIDEECANEDDYQKCIREKLTALEKETKDDPVKNAVVKLFKRLYADVSVCNAKGEAARDICDKKPSSEVESCIKTADKNVDKCADKANKKFFTKIESLINQAITP